jgi:hypothetical protein
VLLFRINFCFLQMTSPDHQEFLIVGMTSTGKTFRPSDWAERLAGVMSTFRPGGPRPGSHLSYSPWCVPNTFKGFKCVVVNTRLKSAEPMAWDFVMNFAKDNDLFVSESSQLPEVFPPVSQPKVPAHV